ncbi:hypothetical protein HYPSUDRAFT_282901 [Hypholoma sublateritium FD-334 SS-4]|uniref:Uncharacterized protein n=1 Tax=Hypholoma sublateritium (strain FD-334 SS-4) TaxID=945553 RepID=A0A0D2MRW7_HYPSF|nr:hypothetical protein HYPSUDRAFT_282901 [Hypholoma sublateritium FD-334 SS-4]
MLKYDPYIRARLLLQTDSTQIHRVRRPWYHIPPPPLASRTLPHYASIHHHSAPRNRCTLPIARAICHKTNPAACPCKGSVLGSHSQQASDWRRLRRLRRLRAVWAVLLESRTMTTVSHSLGSAPGAPRPSAALCSSDIAYITVLSVDGRAVGLYFYIDSQTTSRSS